MTSPSSKAKTTNTESTLHEKFDCQEASNKLGKVNYCIDELTDYQLPSLHKSFDYCSTDQSNKNKNVIQDKDIQPSPNNGDDNSKNYLWDSEFQSSVQIEYPSDWIDTETI